MDGVEPEKMTTIKEGERYSWHPHSQSPATCTICKKAFTRFDSMKRHYKAVHVGEKPEKRQYCRVKKTHTCSKCEKTFSSKNFLLRHVVQHHPPACDYACRKCDQHFTTELSLEQHQKTHTGDKLENICACGIKFNLQFSLQRHQQICQSYATKAESKMVTENVAALSVKKELYVKVENYANEEEVSNFNQLDFDEVEVKEEPI